MSNLLNKPFRHYIFCHRRAFALGLIALFLTNAFDAFPPLLIGRAIDQLTGPRSRLAHTLLQLLAVTAFLSLFRYLWRFFWGRFHHSVADDLRSRLIDHFLELGPEYFGKTQIGKAMALITNDVNSFRMAIGPGLLILFDGLSILILVPPIMLSMSVAWTLKTLCLLPIVPFFVYFSMRRLHILYEKQQTSFAEMSGVAQEIVTGVRVIKSFAQEYHQTRYFNSYSRNYEDACNQVAKTDSFFLPVLELFVSIGSVLLMFIAAPDVIAGRVTIGQFLAFFQYVQRMIWPMTSIGMGMTYISQGRSAFHRIRKVLETKPTITDVGMHTIDKFRSLEVKNLTYKSDDRMLIKNLSFKIEAGQKIGIVGATGAGKSLMIDLICRLREGPKQSIFMNDRAIEEYSVFSLREQFAVVPQEVFLFQDSIRNNLNFGKSHAATKRALAIAALEDEIEKLTEGLETRLGERGVNLSGGQKQRLTIARAWLKQAPVLIFDDSLSAVDTTTEKHILSHFKNLPREQTVLFVTHRLSALQAMDQILVMKNGELEAAGSYSQVRTRSSVFRELEELQWAELK